MTDGDGAPPGFRMPASEEAESLRRLLEYARLVARDLGLPVTEHLVGAALRSLTETVKTRRVDPGFRTPMH